LTLYFKPPNDIINGIKTLDGSRYGFIEDDHGYIEIYEPTHKNTQSNGWIKEHRWIMSEIMGRPLKSNEVVHHINGFKKDNRIQNLELLDVGTHDRINYRYIKEIYCYLCGSDKTDMKDKTPNWHFDIDRKILCHLCYMRIRMRWRNEQKKLGNKT